MRDFHFDPDKLQILHPNCERCGAPMWLTRLEPYGQDHDRRTFECKACDRVVVEIVKFK